MAGIDILNLEPSVISRDLRGKFVCLYSLPERFGHFNSCKNWNPEMGIRAEGCV